MISIKSGAAIEQMREAGRINGLAHQAIEKMLEPGITGKELNHTAQQIISQHNGIPSFQQVYGFPGCICVSVNEEVGHGIPGERMLKSGDLVKIDIGVEYAGHHSDCAVTHIIGQGTYEAQNLLAATRQALVNGIEQARSGFFVSDISYAIHHTVKEQGLETIRNAFGHGIGHSLHEDPQVASFGPPKRGPRLRNGMTLAIEPVVTGGSRYTRKLENGWTEVTVDGSLSAHFEHTVLITEKGPEILTSVAPSPLSRETGYPKRHECFTFRPQTGADKERILQVARTQMNPILMEALGRTVDANEIFQEDATTIVIVTANGDFAGFYNFIEKQSSLHLNTVVIDAAFQGKGLGKQVMAELERIARTRGLSAIELCVQTNNRKAIRFYEKLGFAVFDTPYYNTLAMRKTVC